MQLELRGTTTHYQQIGAHQRVLVLLHGWGGSWQSWHPVVARLSERYQLVIPDLPGFGASRLNGQVWSSAEYAKWLRQFVNEVLATQTFNLVGHSFGGKIAALYAAGEGGQLGSLERLVLVGASGLPDPLPLSSRLKQAVVAAVPHPLKDRLPTPLKERLLATAGLATDYLRANQEQRLVFQEIFRENIAQSLVKIETPTLLVWGGRDTETPPHQGKRMARYLPHAELVVLTEAGHFPFVDQPPAFVKAVSSFVG
ncbi:MAG: hypothetical protein COU69_00135 [Candidatus Pacebacteria bacterium CG10_big_fil_rev_8_21_14_0_10_56_10]|nr:MAG: hypothetical protein COU69_00135 [Candidatus Pacebacteria bacterium CG10_big_fil_rev_8_21_14_0_10_56_10]